jgi:hypothetical protein
MFKRNAGACFAAVAFHLQPAVTAVQALCDCRRWLRWAAEPFHLFRPEQAFRGVRLTGGFPRPLTRMYGTDFRAADPITKNAPSRWPAHGAITAALALRAIPLGFEVRNGLETIQVRSTCLTERIVLFLLEPFVSSRWELRMPRTGWTPRIVPYGADQTAYLVIDRCRGDTVYRETEFERTDLETIIADLMSGQFNDPFRIVAFKLEHWSVDVSEYIAFEIQTRCDIEGAPVREHIRDFVDSFTGPVRQLSLRLA